MRAPWSYKKSGRFTFKNCCWEKVLEYDSRVNIDHVFDLTDCNDDGKHDRLKDHWGFNRQIMQNLFNSDAGQKTMLEILRVVCASDRKEYQGVLMVCRSGRHRSLGLTKMLMWVCEAVGFIVAMPWNFSAHSWPKNFCTNCKERRHGCEELKGKVLARFTKWQ